MKFNHEVHVIRDLRGFHFNIQTHLLGLELCGNLLIVEEVVWYKADNFMPIFPPISKCYLNSFHREEFVFSMSHCNILSIQHYQGLGASGMLHWHLICVQIIDLWEDVFLCFLTWLNWGYLVNILKFQVSATKSFQRILQNECTNEFFLILRAFDPSSYIFLRVKVWH